MRYLPSCCPASSPHQPSPPDTCTPCRYNKWLEPSAENPNAFVYLYEASSEEAKAQSSTVSVCVCVQHVVRVPGMECVCM